jgi:hypothetical protein
VDGYHVGATRSDGKWFSMGSFYTNRLPTVFEGLDEVQLDQIREADPTHRAIPNR